MSGTLQAEALDPRVGDGGPGRGHAALVVVTGALGLGAAWLLTLDTLRVAEDPSYVPACSINPVVTCSPVMGSDQAQAFGFPNAMIGLVAFGVVVTLGVLALAGTPLPRWVWVGLAAGSLLGAGFVQWLVHQSLYEIGALCPYCLVVWVATMTLAVWSVLYAWRVWRPGRVVEVLWGWRGAVVAAWLLVVGVLVLERFWTYWSRWL